MHCQVVPREELIPLMIPYGNGIFRVYILVSLDAYVFLAAL
jgi:hypothetical protein